MNTSMRRWGVGSLLAFLMSIAGMMAVLILPMEQALLVGVPLGVALVGLLVWSRWAVLRAGGASRAQAAWKAAAITVVVGLVVWGMSQPLSEVGWFVLAAAGTTVLFWPETAYLTTAKRVRA